MIGRLAACIAILCACQACKQGSKANQSSVGTAKPKSPAAPRHAGAFDLASAETGAVLLTAEGGQLRITLLDPNGKAQKTELLRTADVAQAPLVPPVAESFEIEEAVAATLDTRLAVAWLERNGASSRTRGLSGPISKLGDARAVTIGDVQQPIATPRGNLALAAIDGHFMALSRAVATACANETEHDCVGYSFFRFDSDPHFGLPLAVPAPCAQNAVSFAVSGARFYYGVCSNGSGSPQTVVFTIQNEPAYYARADRVLQGCLPTGAVAMGDELVVAADCAGTRRAVRLRGGDQAPEELRMDRLDAECESGKPRIRQLGSAGLDLRLNRRQDRLEAFLPASYRLPQARAVWTGQTLLVAGLVDAKVTLKAYRCDSTLLREVALE